MILNHSITLQGNRWRKHFQNNEHDMQLIIINVGKFLHCNNLITFCWQSTKLIVQIKVEAITLARNENMKWNENKWKPIIPIWISPAKIGLKCLRCFEIWIFVCCFCGGFDVKTSISPPAPCLPLSPLSLSPGALFQLRQSINAWINY